MQQSFPLSETEDIITLFEMKSIRQKSFPLSEGEGARG